MNRLIVALDVDSEEEAIALARLLGSSVGGFKVGLQLLMGVGPRVVESVAELGRPVLVDAKLHDIPNTVRMAARALGARGTRWLTVHATGGPAMVQAAVDGIQEGSEGEAGILVVTILTSIDAQTMSLLGMEGTPEERVGSYAAMADGAGAEGVVCSVGECAGVRAIAPDIRLFTPGIRKPSDPVHDQARVATPAAAVAAGADYLVIGRPVIQAEDPVKAAKAIISEIGGP